MLRLRLNSSAVIAFNNVAFPAYDAYQAATKEPMERAQATRKAALAALEAGEISQKQCQEQIAAAQDTYEAETKDAKAALDAVVEPADATQEAAVQAAMDAYVKATGRAAPACADR